MRTLFNVDSDDEHADWPKRTNDLRASLVPAGPRPAARNLSGEHDRKAHGHGGSASGAGFDPDFADTSRRSRG